MSRGQTDTSGRTKLRVTQLEELLVAADQRLCGRTVEESLSGRLAASRRLTQICWTALCKPSHCSVALKANFSFFSRYINRKNNTKIKSTSKKRNNFVFHPVFFYELLLAYFHIYFSTDHLSHLSSFLCVMKKLLHLKRFFFFYCAFKKTKQKKILTARWNIYYFFQDTSHIRVIHPQSAHKALVLGLVFRLKTNKRREWRFFFYYISFFFFLIIFSVKCL